LFNAGMIRDKVDNKEYGSFVDKTYYIENKHKFVTPDRIVIKPETLRKIKNGN